MSAMREAVMYHEETNRNMLSLYPLVDNLNVMMINVQMEIAELSLNLFVTSKVKEKKYLSVRVEKKDKKWQATFLPRCCVNRMEVWSSSSCKKECSLLNQTLTFVKRVNAYNVKTFASQGTIAIDSMLMTQHSPRVKSGRSVKCVIWTFQKICKQNTFVSSPNAKTATILLIFTLTNVTFSKLN